MNSRFESLFKTWTEGIPLVAAMQIQVCEDQHGWSLQAPLAPNRNHMSTGFGGSLAAIATLAGWAQTWMLLPEPDQADIVIGRSDVRYLKPAEGELTGTCDAPAQKDADRFLAQFNRRGRAGIVLTTRVHSLDIEVTTLTGKFVATRK